MIPGTLRSLLFVPGDSDRKQARALSSGADALILDLEDSVAEARLGVARDQVRAFLGARSPAPAAAAGRPPLRSPQFWVRLNGPSSGKLLDDLVAVMGGRPDGVVLPKVSSVREVDEVGHYLSALEARDGIAVGSTRILVIATETPAALLALGEYARAPTASEGAGTTAPGGGVPAGRQRLAALTWGMEDLSAALGTTARAGADGSLTPVLELARSLCLITAAAAGVQAIDGVHADFKDISGLSREALRARRDGFTAKLAIHPDQVPVINTAFSPTADEIERARRVVAAFEAAPGAGVTSLDGQMLDRPHLAAARRILERSARAATEKS